MLTENKYSKKLHLQNTMQNVQFYLCSNHLETYKNELFDKEKRKEEKIQNPKFAKLHKYYGHRLRFSNNGN